MENRCFVKEPCDIILLAGQSNAVGCGVGEVTEEIQDNPDVLLFYDTQFEGFKQNENGKEYLAVHEPFIYDVKIMSEHNTSANIAFSFANKYVKDGRLQTGRKLLIVRAAVGGTGFFKHEWSEDGVLFRRMQDMLKTALAMNKENRVIAICWHQGESDAFELPEMDNELRQKDYEIHLERLIREMRKICKNDNLPLMTGGFTQDWSKHFKPQCNAVIAGTKNVCQRLGHARFHSTEGLLSNHEKTNNGDDIHFCRESLHILGERYYCSFVGILEE